MIIGKWLSLAGAASGAPGGAGRRRRRSERNRLRWVPAESWHQRGGRVALTMVSCWDTGVLLRALLGGLLVTGEARPGAASGGGEQGSEGIGTLFAGLMPRPTFFLLRRAVGVGAPEEPLSGVREHRRPWLRVERPLGA